MKKKWGVVTISFILFLPFCWAEFSFGSLYRVLTILLMMVMLVKSGGIFFINSENKKAFFAFLIYCIFSSVTMIWNEDFNAGLINAMGMILLLIILVSFATEKFDKEYQKKLEVSWVITGILSALLFILGERSKVGIYGSRTSLQILGTATDPNEFAGLFVLTIGFTGILFLEEKKILKKLLLGIVIIVELYVVLILGSRGALISAFCSLLLTLLFTKKVSIKTIIKLFILCVILFFVVHKFILPLIPEDILNRLTLVALVKDKGSGRSDIWIDAINQMLNGSIFNLFFGHGIDGVSAGTFYVTNTMHNQLIQNFVCYGIIGTILYLNYIIKSFSLLYKYNKKYLGIFLGIMIMSMTITMGPSYKPLWIFMNMIFVHYKCLDKEESR